MSPSPLDLADVRSHLEKLLERGRRRDLVAFHGGGEAGDLEVAGGGSFRVRPVSSELELRAAMPPPGSGERVVFLVPFAGELPLDLAGRFMGRGKVQKVGRESRLKRLFGVRSVDPEVLGSPLVDRLLESPPEAYRSPDGRLTLEALWRLWLGSAWGVDTAGGLGLDRLLAWAAGHGGGPGRGALDDELAAALDAHLGKTLGAAGPVVWRAWEAGRGRELLAVATVLDALGETPSEAGSTWIDLCLKKPFALADDAVAAVARGLGRAAPGALRALEARPEGGVLRAVLAEADALVAAAGALKGAVLRSTWLPSAWELRLERLGEVLLEAAKKPSFATVREAIDHRKALANHRFWKKHDGQATFARADMAVRLAAWLYDRGDGRIPSDLSPYADAVRLGRWYVEEGGYVDYARHLARRTAASPFGRGVAAVVERVDAERRRLDLAFARGLGAWIEAGQPAEHVLPIDQAVKKTAAAFLKEDDDRRLLVLLLDGMGWAQAVKLLESLSEESACWLPLAWHHRPPGRFGDAPYPVVFAALPTLTQVSRAAFWSGKRPSRGTKAAATRDDPKRLAANRWLQPFFDGGRPPRLFLREDGFTKDGTVRPEALRALESEDERVVGFVVNAVDSWLASDPQQHHDWRVDAIHPLRTLLDKAMNTGRAVLLASDHGHVPGDRLESVSRRGADGGARWRVWSGDAADLEPFEVGFGHGAVWTPPGSEAVALLADDGHSYGSANHAGEHGGASLAEVVCPLLLVGCEPLAALAGDAGFELGNVAAPFWWHLEPTPPPAAVAAKTPSEGPSSKGPASETQLRLDLAPAAAPAAASRPKSEPAASVEHPLAASKIFQQQTKKDGAAKTRAWRQRVLGAVAFLESRHGVAGADAFAQAMGELPLRVGGLVSRLSQVLNYDQYEVLRYDAQNRQVELDSALLEQLFEVER